MSDREGMSGHSSAQRAVPSLQGRALDDLRFIRETMENASAFTAVSGWGMVAVGAVAFAAATAAVTQSTVRGQLTAWFTAAALSIAISAYGIVRKSRRANVPLFHGAARKFLLSFLPPMTVGAILTYVLLESGDYPIVPPMWLMLYGTAVITGGAFSVRVVPVMGLLFIAIGVVSLALPAWTTHWVLGAAFGALHIIFGLIIARRHGG
ncbi:MAG: hypothetical protein ACT4PJ_01155 [Gemmatimonadaceae bacterium]